MTSITYKAPKGDEKVVTFMGVEFFDGQAVAVDNPAVVAKARTNPHFAVEAEEGTAGEVDDSPPERRPGRPPKAD